MKKALRHGEICFLKIKSLPKDLKETNQKEFIKGSHGNPHTFDNGKLYLENIDDYVFGYFKAKDTKLYHKQHSPKGAELSNGNYELRRQCEYLPEGLKPIID